MRVRRSLSGDSQALAEIAAYNADAAEALRLYYDPQHAFLNQRFLGYSVAELNAELSGRLQELERSSSLVLMAAVEAAFRVDYLQRLARRHKGGVLTRFRRIYAEKAERTDLVDDILSTWRTEEPRLAAAIADLVGAFRYRHWLAHGRYWVPKLGRSYPFDDLYQLATTILAELPLIGPDDQALSHHSP